MRYLRLSADAFLTAGFIFFLFSITGCGSSKKIDGDFLYFQKGLDSIENIQRVPVVIKTNDLLSLQISSKSMNQDQASIFNLPVNTATGTSPGYQVSSNGYIDIPLLGDVKAAGLTTEQLQTNLKEKLSSYIKDPAVIVRFQDFKINILGEVKMPGSHKFDKDKVTIIDAISAAGDLTDFGKRSNIVVIREESQSRKYYNIDLRSGTLFQSPVYILQPNDIVYVNATDKKLRALNTNPENQKAWQLFFGITSVAISVATLVITIKNN
ncbi:MAG: polysaccharide biosynthesis/export family protein [Bacteroidota bacterium]